MNELTTTTESSTPQVFNGTPAQIVEQAAEVARALVDVVKQQGLSENIGGGTREYVRVEGWQTLGALVGVTPREDFVKELPDGGYEAKVSLVNVKTERVIASGSALCGADERSWASRPKFARRSMAITRAQGKAYRLAFGWIMHMAGYSATPHEEMADAREVPIVRHTAPFTTETTPPVDTAYNPDIHDHKKQLLQLFDKYGLTSDPVKMVELSGDFAVRGVLLSDLDKEVQNACY